MKIPARTRVPVSTVLLGRVGRSGELAVQPDRLKQLQGSCSVTDPQPRQELKGKEPGKCSVMQEHRGLGLEKGLFYIYLPSQSTKL